MRDIILPDLGEGIEKGIISSWYAKEGDVVQTDDDIVELVTDKAAFNVPADHNGKVVKINDPLKDSPEYINEDCYDEGWMVQVELADPKELDGLMSASEYELYLKEHG